MDDMNRRKFLGTVAGASAWTIVPRRVLGGPGYIAPSDMILLAQVGCGTQAQRQVNTGMVARPDLQFVAVVDPNKDSQNYLDWEPHGNRQRIRRFLGDDSWGASRHRHPRRARRRAREIMEAYYKKQNRPSAGIRSYEDYREMLEKETDIQGIVNITPDHQHGEHQHLGAEEGKGGDFAQAARERRSHEVRRTLQVARAEPGRRRICCLQQHAGPPHARGVDQRRRHRHGARSAQLDEPPLLAAGLAGVLRVRSAGAGRLQLGRCGRDRSRTARITRTTRSPSIAAGTPYGVGCLGDMGFYSLWQPYRILNLGVPEFVEARPNNDAVVDEQQRQRRRARVAGRPSEGQRRPLAPSGDGDRVRRSTRSGTTAA